MCKECGGKSKIVEPPTPYILKQFPPFPKEGILGMYPIHSTCKKEIAEHMAEFQAKLIDKCKSLDMRVRMREHKRVQNDDDAKTSEIQEMIEKLAMEVARLKHDLSVEIIKRKYQKEEVCHCQKY